MVDTEGMSSDEAIAALEGILGEGRLDTLLHQTALDVMRRNLATKDYDNLAELFELGQADQSLFPSTPAWSGAARYREGSLAVVLDHVVFFQRKAWRNTYKVYFALPGKDLTVAFWKGVAFIGSHGFTLHTRAGQTYKVCLDPPRHVNLTEVSGAAEQPGLQDFADQAANFAGAVGPLTEAIGDVGEIFAIARSRRIAKQHQLIWQEIFTKLAAGEAAPFVGTEAPTKRDASPTATTHSMRPTAVSPRSNKATKPAVAPGPVRQTQHVLGNGTSPAPAGKYAVEWSASSDVKNVPVPVFRHGTCTVKHRSADTAAKCRRTS